MTVRLLIAPAGAGKTQACLDRARAATRERPLAPVWICLPNTAQVAAFRWRLAEAGGALGVEVGTFSGLYREALRAAGRVLAELEEPLQHRLLRAVIDRAAGDGQLRYYSALRDKPGFVRALHELIEELKQARLEPARLQQAVQGRGPRLEELARLYAAYQRWLLDEHWIDNAGLGWLAALALERNPALFSHWALVAVDGFDQFDLTQVAFLKQLACQVQALVITLTYGPRARRVAQRRFEQALARLQDGLQVEAEPLPGARVGSAAALARLEAGLFEPSAPESEPGEAVTCLEAPNRAVEVRAVLRWIKERLVGDGLAAREVAILARDLAPYAPLLLETAAEFGVPSYLAEGLPLASNPAVAALLALLSLSRRDRSSASVQDGRFPVRQLLEALRSPYFHWQDVEAAAEPLGFTAEDADLLEQAARAGQVLAGLEQWREALALRLQAADGVEGEERGESEPPPAQAVPRQAWARLADRFERLVERLTPATEDTAAAYAAFVQGLIGDEPGGLGSLEDRDRVSLQALAGVRNGPADLVVRDVEALRELEEALRELVHAAAVLGPGEKVPYERFLDQLAGVVNASRYTWGEQCAEGSLWAASVHWARGLSFRAVAILGLSEGEFPRPPEIEPLLRDSDRQELAAEGLPLEPPPHGAEFTLFYEAVTRARERLLLSRPYLSEDGQPWDASPFWEETLRLFAGQDEVARQRLVTRVRSAEPLPLERAASWAEFAAALSQQLRASSEGAGTAAAALTREPELGPLWQGVQHGAEVLAARLQPAPAGPFEGDCAALEGALAARYEPARPWSASRLEAYRGCPFAFWLGHALELQPRLAAAVGFDPRQLGGMYHEILQRVYQRAPSSELAELLAVLPAVAEAVLEQAPRTYGFRPSQLWEQEKARIRQDIENTLLALAEVSGGWQPCAFELRFGLPGDGPPAQQVAIEGPSAFWLRGVVDRVDRNAAGELRLIDYKSGSEPITPRDLLQGRRIQLALYAWAVQQALGAPVVDGFYWHVRQARRSSLTFEGLDGGAPQAMACAAAAAGEAIEGVRAGRFPPLPGDRGCPSYCPASAFCWRYVPR